MRSRNIILYGPPGTGKTYRTSSLAVQLIQARPSEASEQEAPDRSAVRQQLAEYRRQGRFAFVVFHPSFSYEDFVEGIKPQTNEQQGLRYVVADGIFKQMCVRAAHALYLAQQKNVLVPRASGRHAFDALFFEFIDYLKRSLTDNTQETIFESKTGKPFYLVDINQNNTLLLRMAKGKKAYSITKGTLAKLYRAFTSVEDIKNLRRDMPPSVRRVSSVAWAAFRRLKQYEDTRYQTYQYLLEGKNTLDPAHYEAMKRDVQQLDYATLRPKDYAEAGTFVLVIDEINRGNVAALFGELIALLEDDKRGGQPEALRTTLPYSREELTVPPNLFLVGTMNTADRSVEALDTALRRRFSFEAMNPNPSLLGSVEVTVKPEEDTTSELDLSVAAEPTASYPAATPNQPTTYRIDLEKMLSALNRRLVALLGVDHQLGHGYLMPAMSVDEPLAELRHVIYRKIIPLLQEKFFGEAEGIVSVMGPAFFEVSHSLEGEALLLVADREENEWLMSNSPPPFYPVRTLSNPEFVRALASIYESS